MKKLVLLFFATTGLFSGAFATEIAPPSSHPPIGVVAALKNEVRTYRHPRTKPLSAAEAKHKQVKFKDKYYDDVPLAKQSAIYAGDLVITLQKSNVKLIFKNGDVVLLGPESSFEVAAKKEVESAAPTENEVTLWYGKVRALIQKSPEKSDTNKQTRLKIRSPNAIAGVRGTDFYTEFDQLTRKTTIAPLHGQVEVAALSPKNQQPGAPVLLEEGKETAVETAKGKEGTAPSEPKIIQSTTIANAVYVSNFTHSPTKEETVAPENKVSDADFSSMEKVAAENVQSNTAHLNVEKGTDPLISSATTYEKTLQRLYRKDSPWENKIFNWMKNAQ